MTSCAKKCCAGVAGVVIKLATTNQVITISYFCGWDIKQKMQYYY
jgi:hypothetical protein